MACGALRPLSGVDSTGSTTESSTGSTTGLGADFSGSLRQVRPPLRSRRTAKVISAALLDTAAGRDLGVLATIKRDGRAQLSHVNFFLDVNRHHARMSVTNDRAKVRNLRRDSRASIFVTGADGWSYAVLEGTVELSAIAQAPDDAAVEELVTLYRDIRGEDHPDWDDYRQAMVRDARLVATLHIEHTYGIPAR
jgi:PPOX class probable F420-dependent enzyme